MTNLSGDSCKRIGVWLSQKVDRCRLCEDVHAEAGLASGERRKVGHATERLAADAVVVAGRIVARRRHGQQRQKKHQKRQGASGRAIHASLCQVFRRDTSEAGTWRQA